MRPECIQAVSQALGRQITQAQPHDAVRVLKAGEDA